MAKVNLDWVKEQFSEMKVRVVVGKSILKLLETWNEMTLTDEQAKTVAELFTKLSQNQSVIPEKGDEIWIDVIPGQIKVSDTVRIKSDAYTDTELSAMHNGKRGTIVAIRSGDVIVKYDNVQDAGSNATDPRHSPYKLQKRIK